MKPKTAIQKRVVELSSKLKPATEKQKSWAFEKCLDYYFVRSRNTLFCLECGHSWKDQSYLITAITGCDCPSCGRKLKHYQGYGRFGRDTAYFAIITAKDEYQVSRMFWVDKTMKKGKKAEYLFSEVMQFWIDEAGKITPMSKSVQGLSRYFDQWIFYSELEVRPSVEKNQRYFINPYKIYPDKKVHPIMKRNGFKGKFHDLVPHELFAAIASNHLAETLLKSGQIPLLSFLIKNSFKLSRIEKYWSSIKICIRNNYKIKDAGIWLDYIELLDFFGKDLRSPKYVCPEDLKKVHDRLVRKKREVDKKIEREELREKLREKIEADQLEYEKQKGNFFGLFFSDGSIDVKVLEHVQEFAEEGDQLHHCVFTNEYYKKPESLIMSARIDNKPIETIELSLSRLEISQSRGIGNKASKYHDQILGLVRNNISQIAQRI